MSKSTFKILFYVRKNRLTKQGKLNIMVRITVNGEIAQFSSKLEIDPKLWDSKSGKAKGYNTESKTLNSRLDNIRNSISNHCHEIANRDSFVTAEKIKNAFLGFNTNQNTLLELFKKHNEDIEKLVGISKSHSYCVKYKRTYRIIEEFMRYKYNISDIGLKEINHLFITDLEIYLRSVGMYSHNATSKFIQLFKKVVSIARSNGYIIRDPFANYKITFQPVDVGYLTEQELEKIITKKFDCQRLENVRDIFVFCCFTGLAYIDVKNLSAENIQTGYDDKLWIMTKRQKTETKVNVPILEIPMQIINKYKNSTNGKLLPVLSNQKMNSYLKEIADVSGITKNLTFHLARHVNLCFSL